MSNVKKRKSGAGSDNTFVTVCLLIAGLLAFAKRVSLTNQIGDNGNAYFGMAYDTFLLLFLFSGYWVQNVLARMLAARGAKGQYRNIRRVWKVMILLAVLMGAAAAVVMYFLAGILAKMLFGSVQAATAIECMAPLLLAASLLGVFRGYFQGMGSMVPTAVSRILEEGVGLVTLSYLTGLLMGEGTKIGDLLQNPEYDQAYGAAGAGLSYTAGCIAALLFLLGTYALFQGNFKRREFRDNGKEMEEKRRILRVAGNSAVPVMLMGFLIYGSYILDQALYFLFQKESSGMLVQWGVYTGKYRLLISIPVLVIFGVSSSLLPGLALSYESRNSGRCRSKTLLLLKLSLILALPMTVYLGIMSETLMSGLFSAGDLQTPASLLRVGCVTALLQSTGIVLAGVLQATDQGKKLAVSAAASAVAHVVSLILFLTKFGFGIKGVVYSVIILYAVFLILNLVFVFSEISWNADWSHIIGTPVISSAVFGVVVFFMNTLLAGKVADGALLFLTLFVGIVLYLVMILMLHGLSERELRNVPFGGAVILMGKTLHFL